MQKILHKSNSQKLKFNRKMLKKLFKKDTLGRINEWSVEVENDRFRVHEGILGGKITTSEWTVCLPKNSGKKNSTTASEQAIAEALAKVNKKIKSGYFENIKDVDSGTIIKPMLAHKWEDQKENVLRNINGAVIQPKLDGIRCIGTSEGLFTRNGERILSVPHIEKSVKEYLNDHEWVKFIDGELYNHEYRDDFNKISSIVRKTKDIDPDHKIVEYWVYDLCTDGNENFTTRFDSFQPYEFMKRVSTSVIKNENDIHEKFGSYIEMGFEGAMIRLDRPYENKRSKNLVKYKTFEDTEFKVLDIIEGVGNRSGMAGAVLFEISGKHFQAGIRGGFPFYKELLINKEKYVGTNATVRYQNLTPDGIPRFPVVTQFRKFDKFDY